MIEKKVINLQIEVAAANDDKDGCMLTARTLLEGEPLFVTNTRASLPEMFELDKRVIAARIAVLLGVGLSQALSDMPYPAPSCLKEEALPPEQQGG